MRIHKHVCTFAQTHASAHTHVHKHRHLNATGVRKDTHIHVLTSMHTHTRMQANTRVQQIRCTNANKGSVTQLCTHKYVHMHTGIHPCKQQWMHACQWTLLCTMVATPWFHNRQHVHDRIEKGMVDDMHLYLRNVVFN